MEISFTEFYHYVCVCVCVCVYKCTFIHGSVQKIRLKKGRNRPGVVAHACTPSSLWEAEAGGSLGREFETGPANMVKFRLSSK